MFTRSQFGSLPQHISRRALQLIGGASDIRFKFLCSVTGGPRLSYRLAYFNLKLFDCCVVAPADTIIYRSNGRPVPVSMFAPETAVGPRAYRVGSQSRLSHGQLRAKKSRFACFLIFSRKIRKYRFF